MEYKTELLKDYVKTLKKAGFKVYHCVTNNPITWVYFELNNNIGSVSVSYFGGLDFSTAHKPNKITGTGFLLNENGIITPTIKDAVDCFVIAPVWARRNEIKTVVKYSSFE